MVLAGVRSLTLHDDQPVTWADLSAQFDLTEANLGQNRAEASKSHLQELNTAVAVTASQEPLTEAVLSHFQAQLLLMQAVGLLPTTALAGQTLPSLSSMWWMVWRVIGCLLFQCSCTHHKCMVIH